MTRKVLLVLVVLCQAACAKREPLPGDSVAPNGAVAVAPPRVASAPREPLGAIESRVFPPELIMEHQAELGLSEAQRVAIMAETERAQNEITKFRWDLERDREALAKLLDAEPVDEVATAAAAKRLTDLESKLKAVHLAMLVRIKNQLTPTQKARLREVR